MCVCVCSVDQRGWRQRLIPTIPEKVTESRLGPAEGTEKLREKCKGPKVLTGLEKAAVGAKGHNDAEKFYNRVEDSRITSPRCKVSVGGRTGAEVNGV